MPSGTTMGHVHLHVGDLAARGGLLSPRARLRQNRRGPIRARCSCPLAVITITWETTPGRLARPRRRAMRGCCNGRSSCLPAADVADAARSLQAAGHEAEESGGRRRCGGPVGHERAPDAAAIAVAILRQPAAAPANEECRVKALRPQATRSGQGGRKVRSANADRPLPPSTRRVINDDLPAVCSGVDVYG